MANISVDKTLYSDFSFWKKTKKSSLVTLPFSNVTLCPSKKDTIAAWKKCNFLNINPFNMIVLKFHMLLLYIIKQFQNNVS